MIFLMPMLKRKFQKELISFNLQVAGEKLTKQAIFQGFNPRILRSIPTWGYKEGVPQHRDLPLKPRCPKA